MGLIANDIAVLAFLGLATLTGAIQSFPGRTLRRFDTPPLLTCQPETQAPLETPERRETKRVRSRRLGLTRPEYQGLLTIGVE